jgi:hypothetical protein
MIPSAEGAIPFGFYSGPEPVEPQRTGSSSNAPIGAGMNRAFSADGLALHQFPGALPQATL